MHPKDISIADYTYPLPNDRIAGFPLPERDASKLLICKDGLLKEDTYKKIAQYLPPHSLLVFNNTRVIQARILFQKPSGAIIEIFCLEPLEVINEYSTIMAATGKLRWKCLVGGAGKWKGGPLVKKFRLNNALIALQAALVDKLADAYVVELSWQPAGYSFAEIIEHAGDTPLPPYIKRKPQEEDKERYQTIYARYNGSVAAPTAGLHFTEAIFKSLAARDITSAYITLHVGAGTFKPVKANLMEQHQMHAEWIDVSKATINQLVKNFVQGIIAVGTTSLRTLESLYWMGVKTILFPGCAIESLMIRQWEVYEAPLSETTVPPIQALTSLAGYLSKKNAEHIFVQTQILIAPPYKFKLVKAIITNFHQPQSTLLLLVAAAMGNHWKKIYEYALENDFRFLSYGDGSLLFLPDHQI